MSITQMAASLGVGETHLYRLRAGTRKPGVEFLRAVIREYPDLRPLVIEYVTGKDGQGEE